MSPLPRDFIATREGLVFAVVDAIAEEGRLLCVLRYVPEGGTLRKLSTAAANAFLQRHYPQYLHYSERLDVALHGVPATAVQGHYRARDRMRSLSLLGGRTADPLEQKLLRLLGLFSERRLDPASMGLTGSLLIGAQRPDSDFDLVTYSRESFAAGRAVIRQCIAEGGCDDLDEAAWRQAFDRRGSSLAYPEFLWHERRKGNKASFEGTKFDLSLVTPDPGSTPEVRWRKRGSMTLAATVVDASGAFDYPACYVIDHPEIRHLVAYTQTYAGQARNGEAVEASGTVEQGSEGGGRLVIGASREAPGAYLRVRDPKPTRC